MCTLYENVGQYISLGRVLASIGKWIGFTIPISPRLCLLGDSSVLLGISKYDLVFIKVGVITAAQVILSVWRDRAPPEFNRWRENLLRIVSHKKSLARLNDDVEDFNRSWGRVLD